MAAEAAGEEALPPPGMWAADQQGDPEVVVGWAQGPVSSAVTRWLGPHGMRVIQVRQASGGSRALTNHHGGK
jgi:hypothetical protein